MSQFGGQQGGLPGGNRSGRGNSSGPATGAAGAGVRWEYKTYTRETISDLGKNDFAAGLNKLGDEGWELVAVPGVEAGRGGFGQPQAHEYYFKRRKGPAAEKAPAAQKAAARETPTDADGRVVIYPLKNARAPELAKTVQQVLAYRGDRIIVIADPRTNSLIIRGPQKQVIDVENLVQRLDIAVAEDAARAKKPSDQLDRPPHSVAVEVLTVELPARKADDKAKGPDEKDFSGTIADVVERLDAMMKKGQVAGFKRIQVTMLEGQPGSLMLGETKPYVMGATVTGTGITSRHITYRNVGTQVRVTPHVAADRSVTLDLNVQDSRARDSATATVGTDEKGNAIPATEFIQTSFSGKISVASGKATLAKDAKVNTSKEGQGETLIVVGARVIESSPVGK